MKFEQAPGSGQRFEEFLPGQTFEVRDVNIVRETDLKVGDRVMIRTESGNRYMIRFSESARTFMIYSERKNFEDGEELYNKYTDGTPVAEVGRPFEFIRVTGKEKGKIMGTPFAATTVTAIEIRKGIDTAIKTAAKQTGGWGGGLAGMLKDQFKAKRFPHKP